MGANDLRCWRALKPQIYIHNGRLRSFRPSIELKEKNISEIFQFLHLSLNFLASTAPLTVSKWQNFNVTQAQLKDRAQQWSNPIFR